MRSRLRQDPLWTTETDRDERGLFCMPIDTAASVRDFLSSASSHGRKVGSLAETAEMIPPEV
jgi:hypothetical protein